MPVHKCTGATAPSSLIWRLNTAGFAGKTAKNIKRSQSGWLLNATTRFLIQSFFRILLSRTVSTDATVLTPGICSGFSI